MKKIRSILSIVISLLFVSCGALTSLFVEGQEVSSVTVVESENNQEDNFFFDGTVYSDSFDKFEHAVVSHSGLLEVDFEYPTINTGIGAEGDMCIKADFSDQGDYGILNFYRGGSSLDLTSYNVISFRAKAQSNVSIQVGLESIGGSWNEDYYGVASSMWVDITTEWKEYTVALHDLVSNANDFDLSQVKSVFKVDDISDSDVTFYIDAIYYSNMIIEPLETDPRDYTMQVEWGQLTDVYVNNVKLVNPDGIEVMHSEGSLQLGQVTSNPVTDSYFGEGNALNYVHSGVNDWGGVLFAGIETNNVITEGVEFKVAVKGDISPEIVSWALQVNDSWDSLQSVNIMNYEVDSEDPEWRLFVIPSNEFYSTSPYTLYGIGLFSAGNNDSLIDPYFVACDVIVDIAINYNEIIPINSESDDSYTYQVEWGQLNDSYENNICIVDEQGYEVMTAAGSMQLGQVTTSPVTDSYFGEGNALNYIHDGEDAWGGVFFSGIELYNNLSVNTEFKIAVKNDFPSELTCWEFMVIDVDGDGQGVNFIEYEVDNGDPEWRLFVVPISEFNYLDLNKLGGLGLWNPKVGTDIYYEGGYVGCELIVDVAIKTDANIIDPPLPGTGISDEYLYQIEWDQLNDFYENNVTIVNEYGSEVMVAAGSMQLGQVTTSPVNDSYFGVGNALNYIHDGVDSWGGVFFNGIDTNNDLSNITEFKIAVKGSIPSELTCWGLVVEGDNQTRHEVNFMLYEVESAHPDWRLFVIPATEFYYSELDAFKGMGIWNPKRGLDVTYDGSYVGCDLIIDLAIF